MSRRATILAVAMLVLAAGCVGSGPTETGSMTERTTTDAGPPTDRATTADATDGKTTETPTSTPEPFVTISIRMMNHEFIHHTSLIYGE